MKCLLCNHQLHWQPRLSQWLRWGPISEPVICKTCQQSFHHYQPPFCPGCGRHLEGGKEYCADCAAWRKRLGWGLTHRCLYCYDDAMKEWMHRYKFDGDYLLRRVFCGELTAAALQLGADCIVPVPVTATTMATRGFNQVTGLLNCRLSPLLVTISREKQAQSTKNRQERLATSQPFQLASTTSSLAAKRVLVVDDVYTTGRTIYHAAALLRAAGAREVLGLSLAG